MDMKCPVLIGQPEAVSALGMKLPVGRVYGGGKVVKLFVPNIRRELYDKILEAARPLAGEEPAAEEQNAPEQASENTQTKSETDTNYMDVLEFWRPNIDWTSFDQGSISDAMWNHFRNVVMLCHTCEHWKAAANATRLTPPRPYIGMPESKGDQKSPSGGTVAQAARYGDCVQGLEKAWPCICDDGKRNVADGRTSPGDASLALQRIGLSRRRHSWRHLHV